MLQIVGFRVLTQISVEAGDRHADAACDATDDDDDLIDDGTDEHDGIGDGDAVGEVAPMMARTAVTSVIRLVTAGMTDDAVARVAFLGLRRVLCRPLQEERPKPKLRPF